MTDVAGLASRFDRNREREKQRGDGWEKAEERANESGSLNEVCPTRTSRADFRPVLVTSYMRGRTAGAPTGGCRTPQGSL